MSNTKQAKGSCVCKAVQFEVSAMSTDVGACHCKTCRTWGGGPFMAVNCGSDVAFTGEEHIKKYDSSEWAERGFCTQCGTHLFVRIKPNNRYIITAGIIEDGQPLNFKSQVFIDEKPDFYNFKEETQNMTGPECFAKFNASPEC